MGTQSSTLIMRLIDGVSGPAASASGALRGLNAATAALKRKGGAFAAGMLGTSLKQVAGLALAYKGAMGVKDSLEAEASEARLFTRIGLRAKASEAEIKKARDQVAEIAMQSGLAEEAVQQGLFALAKGPRSLAAAMAILPDAAKIAQAYEIEVKQAAGTTAAMVNQLKIKPADVMAAWDGIASAAHAGRIQVNEFAEGLPGLMTQAARIGWTGTDGLKKILSVAQMVAPAYATTQETFQSMESVIGKMGSDRVVGKFKKMGIDVRAEMDKARASGKDLLETFYNLVLKATKGDMSIVDRIFPKEDFQKFFYALQQYKNKMDLQAKIKFDTGETKQAFDTIAKDAQSAIQNIKTAFGELSEDIGQLLIDAGAKRGIDELRRGVNDVRTAIQEAKDAKEYVFGGGLNRDAVAFAERQGEKSRVILREALERDLEAVKAKIAKYEALVEKRTPTRRQNERKLFEAYGERVDIEGRIAQIEDQSAAYRAKQSASDDFWREKRQSLMFPYDLPRSSAPLKPIQDGAAPKIIGLDSEAMRLASSFQSAGAQAGAAIVSGISSGVSEATRLLEQFNANAKNLLRVTGTVDIKVNAPNLNGQHSDAPNPRRQ